MTATLVSCDVQPRTVGFAPHAPWAIAGPEDLHDESTSAPRGDLSGYGAYRRWAGTPLVDKPVVSVVIPAYNEATRILPTIGAIACYMSGRGVPWELIVADDGSTDSTAELLERLNFANLRVIVAATNTGKGSAVRRGMLAARGDFILFADADQSTPIEQFDQLLDQLVNGFDVAVGSRAANGSAVRGKSVMRRAFSLALKVIVSVGFGLKVADTQCGFKLFTARAARQLFELQRSDGFSFDLEVLYLASKLGLRTAEVPVEWIDAPGSTVDAGRVGLQFLRDLIAFRVNHFRGSYDLGAEFSSGTPFPAPSGASTA